MPPKPSVRTDVMQRPQGAVAIITLDNSAKLNILDRGLMLASAFRRELCVPPCPRPYGPGPEATTGHARRVTESYLLVPQSEI